MENNKINIAELLKDCSPGMELYSPLCGTCVFDRLNMGTIICKKQNTQEIAFTSEGYYMLPIFDDCECVIFPSKDQRDWSKFQGPFKDGDIVATKTGALIGITTGGKINEFIPTYCVIQSNGNFEAYFESKQQWIFSRLATEEEKERLFKYIKDNGYKWNAETKTLEKLVEPKFKVGDRIRCKNATDKYNGVEEGEIVSITDNTYGITIPYLTDIVTHISIVEQDEWELVPDEIKPKFKVGDRIKHRLTGEIYMIMFVLPHGGGTYEVVVTNEIGKSISIKEQDNYELMSDKFDISTLVPFDKVLVRHNTNEKWYIDFFSCIDNGKMFRTITGTYVQCIPYEGNEHLLDTDKDCNDYYKTWEE